MKKFLRSVLKILLSLILLLVITVIFAICGIGKHILQNDGINPAQANEDNVTKMLFFLIEKYATLSLKAQCDQIIKKDEGCRCFAKEFQVSAKTVMSNSDEKTRESDEKLAIDKMTACGFTKEGMEHFAKALEKQ